MKPAPSDLSRPLSGLPLATVFCFVFWMALNLVGSSVSHVQAFAAEHGRDTPAHTNRLIDSNNPYLLLHAHNPVDWYPWGADAFAKARRENKPIFLSISYSTCYWCHVAERTLYSNPEIAKLMNQWFVNVKVDREQRPDIDEIYMLATHLLTKHGGWPNNVFLTPDLKPFMPGAIFHLLKVPPTDPASRSCWENCTGYGLPSVLESSPLPRGFSRPCRKSRRRAAATNQSHGASTMAGTSPSNLVVTV